MKLKCNAMVKAMVSAGILVSAHGGAIASDTTADLVDALVKKGVLTQAEGDALLNSRKAEAEVAKQSADAAKKAPVVKERDGLFLLESADGRNNIQLTGRLHFDYRASDIGRFGAVPEDRGTAFSRDTDTASAANQFEVRRLRIGVKGKFLGDFDYEFVTNLVGSSANLVDVGYINYNILNPIQVRVGLFKQPFNLEEYGTSSNNIDFVERSYINQISPAKRTGAMLHGVPIAGLTYAATVFQQNSFGETDSASDGKGVGARLAVNFAEFADLKDYVFHAGIAGFDQKYGVTPASSANTSGPADTVTRGTIFGFRSGGRGLNNAFRVQIAGDPLASASYGTNSPTSAEVENQAFGLEGIATFGRFKLQSEYVQSKFDASHQNTGNRVEANAKVYYIEGLLLLTGERYSSAYRNGAWSSIKPNSVFDPHSGRGTGAWELGLRYEQFKVSDTNIVGSTSSRFQGAVSNQAAGNLNTNNAVGTDRTEGGAQTVTLGVKWIANSNMRFLLNYSKTKYDTPFRPIDVSTVATAAAGTTAAVGASNANVKTVDGESLILLRAQLSF